MIFTKKLFGWIAAKPLKKQIMILFLPVTLVIVLSISIASYLFEAQQVKINASYLVSSTTQQTASVLNDKLSTIFTQLSRFCDSVAVGNLLINQYDDAHENSKYNDILACYKDMQNIYYTYGDVIESIYFKTNSGTEMKVYKELEPADTDLNLNKWFSDYKDSPYGYYWRNLHADDVFKTKQGHQVLSVFRNIGSQKSNVQGVIIFNMNPSYFLQTIHNTQVSRNGYLMIVSRDGIMKPPEIGKEYMLTGEDIAVLQNNIGGSGSVNCRSTQGNLLSVTYRSIESSQWLLVAVAPQQDFVEVFSGFRYVLVLLMMILITVLVFLCNMFAKNIARPITLLSDRVKQFDRGDDRIDFSSDLMLENEIGTLAMGLSGLKESVYNLLNQVKYEQSQKSRMQLMAMQEQIKPHFLYNTLASIRHLIDLKEIEQAGRMCGALEKFYRIGISGGQEIITVREEIEHVENYLQIQQMRYAKDFDYNIDVAGDILEATILKLTLQPLVENAIYHGIKQKEGRGNIILTGYREENDIIFQIYDDGAGITEGKLKSLRDSIRLERTKESLKNFGLRNVNQRLALYFGTNASLTIRSTEDVFTEVTIRIPYQASAEEEPCTDS